MTLYGAAGSADRGRASRPACVISGTSLGYQLASIIAGGSIAVHRDGNCSATFHSSLPIALLYFSVAGVIGPLSRWSAVDRTNTNKDVLAGNTKACRPASKTGPVSSLPGEAISHKQVLWLPLQTIVSHSAGRSAPSHSGAGAAPICPNKALLLKWKKTGRLWPWAASSRFRVAAELGRVPSDGVVCLKLGH